MDARTYRVSEYLFCERDDFFRKCRIFRRVLDGVPGQRASVADEVSQQTEFRARHGVLFRTMQKARQGDMVAEFELVEASPAVHRQELVVGGRTYVSAQPCCQFEYRFGSSREHVQDWTSIHSPPTTIECEHAEAGPSDQVFDRDVSA